MHRPGNRGDRRAPAVLRGARRWLSLVVGVNILVASMSALAETTAPGPVPGITSVPPVYLMHYTPGAPTDPAFIESIRKAPPNILHLSHAVPLNSIFGPTSDYSGFSPKLVGVDAIQRKKDELTVFVKNLHEAGVNQVICYINPCILGGDHELRKGFFDFYDHWNDYTALGIGPKPERKPELWMQRERRSFAPWEPEPNYPQWRYEPCINEPAWRRYQSAVVRLIAECGYDGVFVDDCIMHCRNDVCRDLFGAFLTKQFQPAAVPAVLAHDSSLGSDDGAGSDDPARILRDAESFTFWQESMASFLGEMNEAGRAVKPGFFTVPNWGATARVGGAASRARSGKSQSVWKSASTFQMLEEDHPAGYFGADDVVGYLLQYNYGLALGVRPVVLSYGVSRGLVEQGYAEAAAGGGGAYVEPTAAFPEVRRKWRSFLETNRDLFDGYTLVAPVGLILSYDEPRYRNDEHLRQAYAVSRMLYKRHVPFTVIPPQRLEQSLQAKPRVIIAPEVLHLSDAQVTALKEFVRTGGRLLIVGRCGLFDLTETARSTPPFADAFTLPDSLEPPPARDGDGAAVQARSAETLMLKREVEIVAALDIRKQDAFTARLRALASQPESKDSCEAFYRLLTRLAGSSFDMAPEGHNVCAVQYQRLGETTGTVVVHAVRYAVPTWDQNTGAIASAPLKVSVQTPPGWTVERGQAYRPDSPATFVELRMNAARVECELPPFECYSLLRLTLSRKAP